ncbi:bifunctional 23S rRNA (guanine(2069)-N(7))-methyltransferase RlmK/23S rRNA (guanine(2445)-N(2))-methyltransferase RlmL [Desulfogranum japonicum]|uniref:bifunctional 23S rRNA (guanine(2069)-N(7))-methyltransferase RlmK/23S rRNA (guanine(2445)-N(2))-methyltransferase RlmL n=1 Tax=Desulfogranum japonicum TaxID=231447 RepID=UPI00068481CB|nr:bifunctional 23S rRNA (guanine(2069)-N(7))-methyltransferase RlmK/23S rRNA (guanine(2445)-N(2))-methyltransferase RlmL [Desulfogranum japonicum]
MTTSPAIRRKRKKKKQPQHFVATCGAGLESLVCDEISSYGGENVKSTPGAVSWSGTLESGYRACLWSRFASRILYELCRFEVADTDTLYKHAGTVDWNEHFGPNATFAIYTTLVDAELTHSQFASLRVKDAIVDQFRKRFGKRPNVDVEKPGIRINLHVQGTQATLALDISGDSLHRRGYRLSAGEAPLKETLAAGIVQLSGCLPHLQNNSTLLDPMCGSGTLLIEAALMLGKTAPGLARKTFGFMFWNKHDKGLWNRLSQEALNIEEDALPEEWPQIIGYDTDPKMVEIARKNVIAAGLRDVITIEQQPLAQLTPPSDKGFLLTNPPYGERLSDKMAIRYLYRFLGRRFREQFPGWHIGVFTAHPDIAESTNLNWQERTRLFNGPIKCQLLTGVQEPFPPLKPFSWQPAAVEADCPAPDFANRLLKNCTSLLPWAEKENIQCFRIYDRDIPEYNLAVDLYEEWIHVQEFAAPETVDESKAAERFSHALEALRQVMQTPHSKIFIKTRKQQKGKEQYQKKDGSQKAPKEKLQEVHEGGLSFLVNFTDFLDTGLFLDHRITRAKIASLARGKSFLNLFAYTGTASVYAASGGARETTTVDISARYLSRARANMALNGYGGPRHRTEEADCMQWLRKDKNRYDLIFVDPPTFSNSRHTGLQFSVQQDHETLLHLAMKRLTREGILIFSNNFRKFKLAESITEQYQVEDISSQTLPHDFSRNPRIHSCWQLSHR